jgi:hypothetical protein
VFVQVNKDLIMIIQHSRGCVYIASRCYTVFVLYISGAHLGLCS